MPRTSTSVALALLAGVAFLSGAACEQRNADTPNATDRDAPNATSRDVDEDRSMTAPRGRNTSESDRTTATDQSESNDSIQITAAIRRSVLAAENMSISAQNCTIVTDERGAVSLRGDVRSQAEKDAIGAIAKATAGVTSVDNQLNVNSD